MGKTDVIDDVIEYAASKGTIMVAAPGAEVTPVLGFEKDGPAKRTLSDIALHAGAFVWSTLAGITGDYALLGGYEGIYQRLEMGLAKLRSK